MRRLLISILCTMPLLAQAEDNLLPFLPGLMFPHPICGINPNFDGQPKNIPTTPFAMCRTLALGYSAKVSYPDPGVDALSKLIVALAQADSWEQRFKPVSEPPLNCRPARPLGMGGPSMPGVPVCTLNLVRTYLADYDSQPIVQDFRRFEKSLRQLNLSDAATVEKVRQAVAIIRATGSSITFKEVADLLE